MIYSAYYWRIKMGPYFRLAGSDLGSPCIQAYHLTILNLLFLYLHFQNVLGKGACLSSFFNVVPASGCDTVLLSYLIYSALYAPLS